MSFSFVFPGQGSQIVGMGKEIYDAFPSSRDIFEEVDETLKQNLSKIIFQGSESDLLCTENTQPALMVVSMAIYHIIEHEIGFHKSHTCTAFAGHSLGEYTAYTAAKSFTLSQAATLLKTRGLAMQKAVPLGEGKMAAILGLDSEMIENITAQYNQENAPLLCMIANDNAPGQIVISGHSEAVDEICKIATIQGAKRAIALPVSAPFHCALMEPAAKAMDEAFQNTDIHRAKTPIISNVNVELTVDPDIIRSTLIQQVTGRVRWREAIMKLKSLNTEHIVEIGSGKVLTGLTKRIDRSLNTFSIQSPKDVEDFANFLERS